MSTAPTKHAEHASSDPEELGSPSTAGYGPEFIKQRSHSWKIDAMGRLQWIEGMYELIRRGRVSRNADIR